MGKEKIEKPSLVGIIMSAGVSSVLTCNALYLSKDVYNIIIEEEQKIHELFGKVGYEILEKSVPIAVGLSVLTLAYISGKATYQMIKNNSVIKDKNQED